jgi:twitching motility protein PilJ
MNMLSGIKISHKIASLMIGLVAGFLLMGVAYYAQIASENQIEDSRTRYDAIEKIVTSAMNTAVQVRDSTPVFISSSDEIVLENYQKINKTLEDSIASLSTGNNSYINYVSLQNVKSASEDLSKNLRNVYTKQNNIKPNLGILNEDSKVSLDIKSQLKDLFIEEERFSGLFKGSQDYISGKKATGYDLYLASYTDLKKYIAESNSSELRKLKALETLSAYNDAFVAVAVTATEKEAVLKTAVASVNNLIKTLEDHRDKTKVVLTEKIARSKKELGIAQKIFGVVVFLTAVGTTLGIFLIYRSIVLPLWHIQAIIGQQNKGNTKARANLKTQDELGSLGRSFNRLLDERIQVLENQAKDNEQINNSIITLIKSLGMIAKKDLTIKVPVSSDITGTVSDAVNLLTSETAKTLLQVTGISSQINKIADVLQDQSNIVNHFATLERQQVNETTQALTYSAKTMNEVAKEARSANHIATAAIDYTVKAQDAVTQTVSGIQEIRGTISETEKRIKRLGDRSQEITGIVNLINSISERTHILALNASMHAASAGEAGKGFAVVAEEVQRLAENARAATAEISSMVNNIRVETSDTVNIMNKLITQVAEGTKLAEDSGKRMQETESATRQLVEHVKSIAINAIKQATISNRVRDRATFISDFTDKTNKKLVEQKKQTDELKLCANNLVEKVSVFSLPEYRSTDHTEFVPIGLKEASSVEVVSGDLLALNKNNVISEEPVNTEHYDAFLGVEKKIA